MDLDTRQVAKLLNVSEDTIYGWARGGALPCQRVHDQYRFNRVEIQEWAARHKHRVSPDLFVWRREADVPSLGAAIGRGGVYYDLPGERREDVLAAVSELPGIPAGVDRARLRRLLVAREVLAPTAVGDGFAIPHPRDPLVVRVAEPHVLLAFLKAPVDFQARDHEPVRALFTVLSPSVHQHLQLLAQLAFVLHDPALKALLRARAPQEALFARLGALEGGRWAASGNSSGKPDTGAAAPSKKP